MVHLQAWSRYSYKRLCGEHIGEKSLGWSSDLCLSSTLPKIRFSVSVHRLFLLLRYQHCQQLILLLRRQLRSKHTNIDLALGGIRAVLSKMSKLSTSEAAIILAHAIEVHRLALASIDNSSGSLAISRWMRGWSRTWMDMRNRVLPLEVKLLSALLPEATDFQNALSVVVVLVWDAA